MRAWRLTRLRPLASKQPTARLDRRFPAWSLLSRRFSTSLSRTATTGHEEKPRARGHYAVFDEIERPGNDVKDWLSLLDGGLPPHLRNWESSASPPSLSAVDVAEVLLAAHRRHDDAGGPLDLLYHLGFEENRWSAVIWLIKRLVEKFPAAHGQTSRLARVNALWDKVPSLKKFSRDPFDLPLEASVPRSGLVEAKSLHELTDGLQPENMSRAESLRHDALGQIWLTLGSMIKACANTTGDIKPEVLEIIAYLHHKEVMPLAIYQPEPPKDASAIHQPPLLSMLSSRILTSLSDAAWRAHEKMIVEEAKAMGGDYAAIRPEVPGSVYRVNVAGLRPEVWLELILWSCLHGGWIEQGAEILAPLGAPHTPWDVFSWREYEDAIAANSSASNSPWNDPEYLFKTRAATSRDAPSKPGLKVVRTVSAEVVNAYIDVLITVVNVGVGHRGVEVETVLEHLRKLKILLHKHGKRATLSTGSWDALVLRIVESRSIAMENDSSLVRALVQLSPGLGQGLESKNTQDLPGYVLDGSLAMQGLLHRALYGQIMAGSFEGALEIFTTMQKRADIDKTRSLASFMEGKQPLLRSLTKGDLFTSNLNGIDYPAFDVHIPPTTLGSLLELATDAKAFDFGKWLLYNDDVDGPAIGQSLYKHPHVQPAIVRFAAEALDNKLLDTLSNLGLQRGSYRSLLDSQVKNMRWDSAERILEHLASSYGRTWSMDNLGSVIRAMLFQVRGAKKGNVDCRNNLARAKAIAADMFLGRYNGSEKVNLRKKSTPKQNVLAVLSAVNDTWNRFCAEYREPAKYQNFLLSPKVFNDVLEGVIEAYGSAAGRRLLGIFWPHTARRAFDASLKFSQHRRERMGMSQFRPAALESTKRQRITIPSIGRDGKSSGVIVIYGALAPNTATIMLIVRKTLEELRSAPQATQNDQVADATSASDDSVDLSPRGRVKWGLRRLAELPYVEGGLIGHIDQVLSETGMADLRKELPKIVEDVESELEEEANLRNAEEDEASMRAEDSAELRAELADEFTR